MDWKKLEVGEEVYGKDMVGDYTIGKITGFNSEKGIYEITDNDNQVFYNHRSVIRTVNLS